MRTRKNRKPFRKIKGNFRKTKIWKKKRVGRSKKIVDRYLAQFGGDGGEEWQALIDVFNEQRKNEPEPNRSESPPQLYENKKSNRSETLPQVPKNKKFSPNYMISWFRKLFEYFFKANKMNVSETTIDQLAMLTSSGKSTADIEKTLTNSTNLSNKQKSSVLSFFSFVIKIPTTNKTNKKDTYWMDADENDM